MIECAGVEALKVQKQTKGCRTASPTIGTRQVNLVPKVSGSVRHQARPSWDCILGRYLTGRSVSFYRDGTVWRATALLTES